MKKLILGIVFITMTFVMLSGTALATPNWDITGTWTWNYYYGSGTYTHTMEIDTFDTTSGVFSGYGSYNPDPSHTWDITGTVEGDSIDFHIDYTGSNPTYYVDATGTISSATFMSGDATAPGQTATWGATGVATIIDNIAPVVTINSPGNGSFVSGTVDILGSIIEENELSHYNIAIYPGNANFMDFTKRLEQKTESISSGFDNQSIYQWDTTTYDDGEYLIRLAARDKAGNRDLSGDPYSGGDDSQHVIKVIVDSDLDGVLGDEDRCPGTIADTPEKTLGTNRWKWNGEEWETKLPKGEGPQKSFTMEDTHGCSCEQILETMGDGKKTGHWKFGCSISVMEDFIASIQPVLVDTVYVYANDPEPTYSGTTLKSGVQYELEATGTAFAGDTIDFDAKYSITNRISGDTWTDSVSGYESYGPTLLDLEVNGGFVDWGSYSDVHTYYQTVTGTSALLELWIYDIYYPNNVGFITVNIYELP